MNSKRFLMILASGALAVALAALPGSSAHKQEAPQQKVEKSTRIVISGDALTSAEDALDNLALVQEVNTDGDDNVQVFVGGGNGWLGVGVSEVNPNKVKELKLPAERGVVLGKIVPESPASKAGLKENDVVTEINGQRVEGTEQFRRMIREIPSGRTVQLTVWRDGHSQTVNVIVGKSDSWHNQKMLAPAAPGAFAFHMPDMPQLNGLMELAPWGMGGSRLGIDAEDLEGDFGKYFGAPEGEGVLVRGVFEDMPAAKAGLKVGDVITSVDDERIRSIGELREKLVEKKGDKTIKLGVVRNKAPLTLTVELPKPVHEPEHRSSVRTNI